MAPIRFGEEREREPSGAEGVYGGAMAKKDRASPEFANPMTWSMI